METFENVVLLSSGIDSIVSALMIEKRYKRTPYLITMDMKYNTKEVQATKNIVDFLGWKDRHVVFDTSSTISGFMVRSDNNFILYRNLFFTMWADNLMMDLGKEYVKFYLGGNRDDQIADNSMQGRKAIQDCLNTLRGKGEIVVTSCISEMSKPELWSWLIGYGGVGYCHQLAEMTSSCYTGINCGDCSGCMRKYFSLKSAGVINSELMFEVDPTKTETIQKYAKRIKGGLRDSNMEENRFNYTKEVLKELKLI